VSRAFEMKTGSPMHRETHRRQERTITFATHKRISTSGKSNRRRRALLEQLESRYVLDNSFAAAIELGDIAAPVSVDGFVGPDDQADYYHFTVTETDAYYVGIADLTADADIYLYRDQAPEPVVFHYSDQRGTVTDWVRGGDTLSPGSYYVKVQHFSGDADYTLTVRTIDPPVVEPQTFSVPENTPNGTIIGEVALSDPDSPGVHWFSTIENFNSPVAIYGNTGEVVVVNSSALDFANQPTFTFTARVSDETGMFADVVITINVLEGPENQSPTISPIPDQTIDENGSLTITYTIDDDTGPDTLAMSFFSSNNVLFPANSVVMGGSGATRTLTFTPAANQTGTTTFSLAVQDSRGGSVVEMFEVTVVPETVIPSLDTPNLVQIVPDPDNPGRGLLVVNGSSTLDFITVNPRGTQTVVLTNSGGTRTFNNADFDRILINSFEGSDRIILSPLLKKPATINSGSGDDLILSGQGADLINAGAGFDIVFGRDGNDFLFGEAGVDFLYGEGGNDVLIGGAGTDTLSGGLGADILNGGGDFDILTGDNGDDLLIGGNFTHATSLVELHAIQAIWTANNPFATRITNLSSHINAQTVTGDSKSDWIFTGAGRDWVVDYAYFDFVWDLNFNPTNGDKWNGL
jgi:Ca2+-binding RTX toxin-like protein